MTLRRALALHAKWLSVASDVRATEVQDHSPLNQRSWKKSLHLWNVRFHHASCSINAEGDTPMALQM